MNDSLPVRTEAHTRKEEMQSKLSQGTDLDKSEPYIPMAKWKKRMFVGFISLGSSWLGVQIVAFVELAWTGNFLSDFQLLVICFNFPNLKFPWHHRKIIKSDEMIELA